MENNEEPKFVEEFPEEESDYDDDDAISLSDLTTGYISAAKVGEEPVEFTVSKVIKLTGDRLMGKTREGKVFKKNLSNVEYGYEIVTTSGDKYGLSSWEVFGKMKSIFQKLQVIEGVKLQITHVLDGMKAENKDQDKYIVAAEVEDKWNTLDRTTKEWSVC